MKTTTIYTNNKTRKMPNDTTQTEAKLSLWKYFTDDAAIVGIRIFGIRGLTGLIKVEIGKGNQFPNWRKSEANEI
ncbi:hypothetical protein GD597_19335 [Panacibacter sp. KCS-6]|uniref:Uncharacterized protein n=2 Tax=Limnovirga soli TaxID=2656915 RepID=A0A8J8JT31_9BACT|nr:hypothetical protein [Limnovirga soli]